MKKIMYILCLFIILIILKYYLGDYTVNYNIDKFNIEEKVLDGYTYIKINYEDNTFVYKFDLKRGLKRNRVESIKLNETDGYLCVMPIIKNLDTYFLCSKDDDLFTLSTLDVLEEVKFSEDIEYVNKLNYNEFIYLWKYDGFYTLNKDLETINIFNSDRYSNDLMYSFDKYIVFPVYDKEYLFSDFYLLDMSTGKYKTIKTKYSINYDSYYVGNRKNNIYLFDNKNNVLYEINYKKLNVKVVGDEMKGFIKYEGNKKKSASLSEYTNDKITYFSGEDSFLEVNKNYYSYDGDTWIKYFSEEDIEVVGNVNNNIYFIYEDNLYKYSNSNVSLILHYFEYNFNKSNITFCYNK